MDPKTLIRNKEYVLKHIPEQKIEVIYLHETINHYIFLSKTDLMPLTPSMVHKYIEHAN